VSIPESMPIWKWTRRKV